MTSLAGDVFVPGLKRRRYLNIAARACGRRVARRSWVAVLDFPRSQSASAGLVVAYLARTAAGWELWYEWIPNLDERGFV
ncbi:MAG TPA: hypothetical protein VHF89_11610 [Solirubrobacteraceae bacterium]|nr:hypothetical protein [Solirubrobacteraceae bacterium]